MASTIGTAGLQTPAAGDVWNRLAGGETGRGTGVPPYQSGKGAIHA